MANANKAPLARRVLKGLLVLVTVGVVGLATLLSVLWLERRGDVTLPEPTGPFAVGRAMYTWGNGSPDILAPAS